MKISAVIVPKRMFRKCSELFISEHFLFSYEQKRRFLCCWRFVKRIFFIFGKKKLRQVSNDIMSNCINIIIGIRSIFVKIILISAVKTI